MSFDSQKVINKLRELISIDSSPGNGTQEIARFLFKFCQELDLDCRVHEETISGISECSVLIGDVSARPRILLHSHLDTNEPGSHALWDKNLKNPYHATIHDNQIYGLGAGENKSDFLCKLIALQKAKDEKKAYGAVAIGTFDGLGAMTGSLKSIRRYNLKPKLSLVGAPTSGKAYLASPGQLIIRLIVPFDEEEILYREQHDLVPSSSSQSKVFHSKSNAIKEMLSYLSQLPTGLALIDIQGGDSPINIPLTSSVEIDLVGILKKPITQKLIFWLDQLTRLEKKLAINPTIKSSSQNRSNVVNLGSIICTAEQIEMQASVILTANISGETYDNTLVELKNLSENSGCRIEFLDMKKAFNNQNKTDSVIRLFKDANEKEQTTSEFNWCTEASLFGRVSDECILFGPGQKSNKGTDPYEHVRVDDLLDTTELYYRAITETSL